MAHEQEQTEQRLKPLSPSETALNYFFQHFPPADNFKTADQYLTSVEIWEYLLQHCPDLGMEIHEVTLWLREQGYHSDNLDMKVVWLIGKAA